MTEKLRAIEAAQLKKKAGEFVPGDTVRVHVKVSEGGRDRLQVFEGTVIGRRGGGIGESFTVRRVSHGVGVERVFPLHSPRVEKVDVVRKGRVRRAKLHYLRGKIGKETRVKEQR
jgi:large subunit ribosomal protein L19